MILQQQKGCKQLHFCMSRGGILNQFFTRVLFHLVRKGILKGGGYSSKAGYFMLDYTVFPAPPEVYEGQNVAFAERSGLGSPVTAKLIQQLVIISDNVWLFAPGKLMSLDSKNGPVAPCVSVPAAKTSLKTADELQFRSIIAVAMQYVGPEQYQYRISL